MLKINTKRVTELFFFQYSKRTICKKTYFASASLKLSTATVKFIILPKEAVVTTWYFSVLRTTGWGRLDANIFPINL